jgi:hypothetical protein
MPRSRKAYDRSLKSLLLAAGARAELILPARGRGRRRRTLSF